MTFGISLIAHAIRMLMHAPGTTFRVILPGLAMVLLSTLAASTLLPDALNAVLRNDTDAILRIDPSDILLMLALGVAGLLGYALMAIHWHRHVLLDGTDRANDLRPGWGIIAFYIWRAFTVALVQMLAAIPILTVLGVLASLTGGQSAPGQGSPSVLFSILAGIAFLWVGLRVSISLPAAAMGQRMGLLQSWMISAPVSGAILAVAALVSLLSVTISVTLSLLFQSPDPTSLLFETCVFLAEGIICVSVLTTLYGHLVEKRSLS
ncbi:hypothetical protein FIU94_16220 [Sulfitobacter sp. THAF37]|uniref:hypothetical protein n=1 Tax=Sulfitobacter sp. THAF37 TaxID=2587855 RepID=UPI0012689D6C|nr:hypothetical protein [Sulfitobacter sp. THAF37]QFT60376.1 hypothetical protein FIU94_16220 [Sulfitobacter sp. THAF37]